VELEPLRRVSHRSATKTPISRANVSVAAVELNGWFWACGNATCMHYEQVVLELRPDVGGCCLAGSRARGRRAQEGRPSTPPARMSLHRVSTAAHNAHMHLHKH
jgi:hypothetical protein